MGWQDRAYNREQGGGVPPVRFSMPPITRLTLVLIVVCLAIFLIQAATAPPGAPAERSPLAKWGDLSFVHGRAFTQPWRWITYQYLHAGVGHVVFNMLGVFFFLPPLERLWGWRRALAFYTAGGICSGLVYGLVSLVVPSPGLIGASGSIFAAMGACALFFPDTQIILLVFPVRIRLAVALFAFYFTLTVITEGNLSNAAHLGGLAFGWFAPYFGGPFWYRLQARTKHRRLLRVAMSEREEQEMVDRILQKVHENGMNSLNWRERRALKKATIRQRERDRELETARRRAW
jgi:membrane associated rhomboid family serine protease